MRWRDPRNEGDNMKTPEQIREEIAALQAELAAKVLDGWVL